MRVLAFGIKSIEHVPLWILPSLNPQRDVRVLRARSVQHDEIHHFAQGAVDLMEIQLELVGFQLDFLYINWGLPSGFP